MHINQFKNTNCPHDSVSTINTKPFALTILVLSLLSVSVIGDFCALGNVSMDTLTYTVATFSTVSVLASWVLIQHKHKASSIAITRPTEISISQPQVQTHRRFVQSALPLEVRPISTYDYVFTRSVVMTDSPILKSHPEDFEQVIPKPAPLVGALGCQDRWALKRFQFVFQPGGTPGVNIKGSDPNEHDFVEQRARMVEGYVMPHAHTQESYDEFLGRQQGLVLSKWTAGGRGNGDSIAEVMMAHKENRTLMTKRFGKPLTVSIIGAGPIGLAGALTWYKLGATVFVYEKYLERRTSQNSLRGFMERSQPFSLINLSYTHLAALGLNKKTIIDHFGISKDEWSAAVASKGGEVAAAFDILNKPIMAAAREKILGADFENYLPSQASLPIRVMQELLYKVIRDIQAIDPDKITMHFQHECTQIRYDDRRRVQLQFNHAPYDDVTSDIIYNCSGGGNVSELFGFTKIPGVQMFGVGAFFKKPEKPFARSYKKPILSRCIRLFTTPQSNWVYINTEISKGDYENADLFPVHVLLDNFARQTGLEPTRDFFKVKIELSRLDTATKSNGGSSFQEGLQFIINGGDAAIQPDFRTASGANIGILGQYEIAKLMIDCLDDKIPITAFEPEYNRFMLLLSKQTHQTVVNLFARPCGFDS